MQIHEVEPEESDGDGVLRLVNPNIKTANLNEIKKICKSKTSKKKDPLSIENMKSVANNCSNQLSNNLQLKILKVSEKN